MKATVLWFNDAKGFGFLSPDDGSEPLFVHFSQVYREGFRTLGEGELVTYEVAVDANGNAQAKGVRPAS